MLHTLAISGYRSIRDLVVPLERLTVVTGPNGSGKSSFYRALRLLADVAQGRAIAALAAEGGLHSTLWAGPETVSRAMRAGEVEVQGTRRKAPVALRLGFASEDYGYAVDLGLPIPSATMFGLDPEIKAEAIWVGDRLGLRNSIATRNGPAVTVMGARGQKTALPIRLAPYESMLMHAADPATLPELLDLRERMRGWRFYDHFRTDPEAPARSARVGTRSPVLASDGADLAAAFQTIREIGDGPALDNAVEDAFPGASIEVGEVSGLLELRMYQRGLLRPLAARELSDGTLRYLLLVTALLTPRPPKLMVLNEPETSLHPDLLPALARLIIQAALGCQIIIVTHATQLVEQLSEAGALGHELSKSLGETVIPAAAPITWDWPKR
ncbi:AAA family ATPase [Xinfangfangia sp. D13-10-4-6]|uniref:AAA family ATPase n=1 Tax=Pseudogemmobacter hezensis TaxID=2737662 RepID=UPI00155642E3|nr:AAA family ATPase [Pseudogemmobacter hezensis]